MPEGHNERFNRHKGGNGRGMSFAEAELAQHLPPEFKYNLAISLGKPRTPGYPTCYKVDFGYQDKKIAVEVDGTSHNTPLRRMQDQKKDAKLSELGWCVLRISNAAVLSGSGISKLLAHMTTLLTER